MIADDSGAIGIGGIIGGESTGVDDEHHRRPARMRLVRPRASIARTGRRHGLTTDASTRFERGIDPMKLSSAIEIRGAMIVDLCGGEVVRAAHQRRVPGRRLSQPRPRVRLSPGTPGRAGRHRSSPSRSSAAILDRLDSSSSIPTTATAGSATSSGKRRWRQPMATAGSCARRPGGPTSTAKPTSSRRSRASTATTRCPSTPLEREPGVAHPTATRAQLIERRVRRTAAARGLDEAVTWSFISEEEAEAFGGIEWRLANPISEEMKVMRPSLLPGLIAAARRNLDRGATSVRLFEIGRRYLGDAEHPTLSLLLAGDKQPRALAVGQERRLSTRSTPRPKCWRCSRPPARRSPTCRCSPTPGRPGIPGRSATLRLGPKTIVAAFGELHPRLVARARRAGRGGGRRNLSRRDPRAALERAGAPPAYRPPALQAITRDFAFIVPAGPSGRRPDPRHPRRRQGGITDARLFDRSEPPTALSLAFEVTLQPSDKSFTDEQIADDLEADRRRRREARRPAAELARAR